MTGDDVLAQLIARAIEMGGEPSDKASNTSDVMELLEPVFEEGLKKRKTLDATPNLNAAALAITLSASHWFQLTPGVYDVKSPLNKLLGLFDAVRAKLNTPS